MKKLFYIFAVLFLGIIQANAQAKDQSQPYLYIEDYEAPQGGQVKIAVKYSTGDFVCTTGQLNVDLPEGLTFVLNEADEVAGEINPDIANGFSLQTSKNGLIVFGTGSFKGEGDLMYFTLNVDPSLAIGTELTVHYHNLSVSTEDDDYRAPEEGFDFKVTVVENRITLDETVGVTDDTPTGTQNVLVKRTIKADNWNTICLPFAMTAEQVAEAFGESVKLAEFTGCTTVNNEDDEATSITVKFESLTNNAIEANHPYLIKVGEDIAEFKVDAVEVNPSEEDATVDCDEYKTGAGSKKDPYVYHYNSFVGTYDANTVLEDEDILFISGNKFYYSNGSTKMKAFRGYFEFYDVLADKTVSAAKIGYTVNDEATSIEGISSYQIVEGVYDLSGRKIKVQNNDLNTLQKGVYIIDGKKVTIK